MRLAGGIHEFSSLVAAGTPAELLIDAYGWPALGPPCVRAVHGGAARVAIDVHWGVMLASRMAELENPGFVELRTTLNGLIQMLRAPDRRMSDPIPSAEQG